jgi:hypothetical protein
MAQDRPNIGRRLEWREPVRVSMELLHQLKGTNRPLG